VLTTDTPLRAGSTQSWHWSTPITWSSNKGQNQLSHKSNWSVCQMSSQGSAPLWCCPGRRRSHYGWEKQRWHCDLITEDSMHVYIP